MLKTMKNTLIAFTATASLLAGQNAFAHAAHCEDTPLGEVMDGMKTDLKAYVAAFKASDAVTMQTSVDNLLAAAAKSKDYVPLKLKDDMPEMSAEHHAHMSGNSEHGEKNTMPGMEGMKGMEGMSHDTHMKHMNYLKGMDKLTQLLTDLKAAGDDKKQIKQILGQIKKHSKSSHEAFRKECD